MALVRRRLHDAPAALDGVQSGEVAAAAVGGVEALEAWFAKYLPQVVLACVVPLAVIAWSAPIDLTSAIIMLATLPLVPVFMVLVGWYTERRTSERYAALVRLSTHFLDVVRGLPTLRAFNRGAAQTQRIAEVSDDYRRATMATLRVSFLSGAVLDLAATLGVALIAVTVGVRLVEGDLGLEAGLTVLILAPELYAPLRALGAQYHASADGMAVADRILDLLDEPAAVTSAGDRPAPRPARGGAAPRGRVVRLPGAHRRGAAGRGSRAAPRRARRGRGPERGGEVDDRVAAAAAGGADRRPGRCGGEIDARDTDADAWRAQLAWVPQRPTILRGTVADNIRLGAPDLPEDAVRRAAVAAGADGFVTALPDGYATVVGEGGRALSAGQAQRLALARALARDAALLVLDEPTANLDAESGALVAEAIRRLPRDRTVLLIAHDRGLTRGMDRVVELRDGRLVAEEEVGAR